MINERGETMEYISSATCQGLLDSGAPVTRNQLESCGFVHITDGIMYSVFTRDAVDYRFIKMVGGEYVYLRE